MKWYKNSQFGNCNKQVSCMNLLINSGKRTNGTIQNIRPLTVLVLKHMVKKNLVICKVFLHKDLVFVENLLRLTI